MPAYYICPQCKRTPVVKAFELCEECKVRNERQQAEYERRLAELERKPTAKRGVVR